jgi:Protein of unknown function (DUF3570)
MQLRPVKKNTKVKWALASATASLLSSPHALAEESSSWAKWSGTFGTLYYAEQDRVSAIEPAISLTAEFSGERKWTNKLVLDSLTGASHNGAAMSSNPQTFTTPSGSGSYTIAPGQVTLDPSFLDTRIALSSSWFQPVGPNHEWTIGVNGSREYDFTSLSLNSSVSRYANNKNTKFSLGVSAEFDSINPVGGAPQGLSTMAAKVVTGTSDSKQVFDVQLGLTQVINRQWIVQVNYNLGLSNGYMNDPYKIVSEVLAPSNPAAGDPTGTYYYDKRPDSRLKHSLFLDSKYQTNSWGIVGTSYRYFFDDWGVSSHTVDIDYRIALSAKWFLEPSVRYYMQSAADFYKYFYIQGTALPEYMSGDYRLGKMTATTFGLEVGKKLNSYGKEISFRAQLYTQTGDSKPGEAYGSLLNQDLYPSLTAVIGQVIYKF